jgi:uncharacterized protein YoxC
MSKAIICVALLALLCTAAYAQNPFDKIAQAAKSVTDTVDKTVNGTRNAVNTVTNGTKSAVDGVKGVGDGVKKAAETVTGKTSAAGFANPAVGVFAAAGFGSLLLLAL